MTDPAFDFLGDETPQANGSGKYTVNFSAFFQGTPETINHLKWRFTNLQNILGIGKTAAINRVFQAGLEALERQHAGELDPLTLALIRKRRELDDREQLFNQLAALYAKMAPDNFLEFCETAGVPDEITAAFLDEHTWRNVDQAWTARARDFLRSVLANGEPVSTKGIRQAAIADGLIADTPQDWTRLRLLASRDNLTNSGLHGHWRMAR